MEMISPSSIFTDSGAKPVTDSGIAEVAPTPIAITQVVRTNWGGKVAQTKLKSTGLRHEYYQPRTGGRLLALDNINLQVDDGEFVTIVGPSGCGKTTFINLCDGLLKPTAGSIDIDGEVVTGPGTDRGMVFQDSCLMPWRTVFKNVIFGLECQGLDNNGRNVARQ